MISQGPDWLYRQSGLSFIYITKPAFAGPTQTPPLLVARPANNLTTSVMKIKSALNK